jgi:hypothetical protein
VVGTPCSIACTLAAVDVCGRSRDTVVRVQTHLRTGDQVLDAVHRPLTEVASSTNARLTSLSLIIDAVDVIMVDVEDAVSKVRPWC